MTPSDSTPPGEAIDEDRPDETTAFDRVYETALEATEPTPYPEIAEFADCSPSTAKAHLDRLASMEVVRVDAESQPARYERNDSYLEWRRASRLAGEHTLGQLLERVRELEERQIEFEERFGSTDPSAVSVFDQDDSATIQERMDALEEWQTIDEEIRLLELARTIVQNDGHLVRR